MCRFPLVVPPFAGWTIWLLVEENPNISYFNSIAAFTAETLTSSVSMFVVLSPSWLLVAWTIPRICSDCWLRRPLPTSLSRISLILIIWYSPSTELQESLHLHHFRCCVLPIFCPYFAPFFLPLFILSMFSHWFSQIFGRRTNIEASRAKWHKATPLSKAELRTATAPSIEVPWFEIGNLVGSMKQV